MIRQLLPVGFICSLLSLVGCASSDRLQQYQSDDFDRTIPTCSGKVECEIKWEAARQWVMKNLRLKITRASDEVIVTDGPGNNGAATAARVVKESVDGNTYRIIIDAYCNNMFGCFPSVKKASLAFNRWVNSTPVPEVAVPIGK